MRTFALIFILVALCDTGLSKPHHSHLPANNTVKIGYNLWVGNKVTEINRMSLRVVNGSTFYDAMVVAANKSNDFKFESQQFQGLGHFITKIGDDAMVPEKNMYWMLFIMNKAPSKKRPPTAADLSPLGVSSLIVENNKHYTFWLTNATFPQ